MTVSRGLAVLLGPPASGKTTVARSVAEHADIVAVEVGRLLRQCARADTEEGGQIRHFVENGQLVPTELVESIVRDELEEQNQSHIVLDGFPRSEEQLDAFFRLMSEEDLDLRAVILLDVSCEEAVERLGARRICRQCGAVYHLHNQPPQQSGVCDRCGAELIRRQDDEPALVRERYADYERQTRPVWEVLAGEFPDISYQQSGTLPVPRIAERISGWLQMDIPESSGQFTLHRSES